MGKTMTQVCIVVATGVGSGVFIWKTIDLGMNGVLIWACWTDFYPISWLVLAVLHHLVAVLTMRLSLKLSLHPINNVNDAAQNSAKVKCHVIRSALSVWDLRQDSCTVQCTQKGFPKFSKACTNLLNHAIYLYRTAIFSSLTVISGHRAMMVMRTYGGIAMASRIVAVWVLEEIGGSD